MTHAAALTAVTRNLKLEECHAEQKHALNAVHRFKEEDYAIFKIPFINVVDKINYALCPFAIVCFAEFVHMLIYIAIGVPHKLTEKIASQLRKFAVIQIHGVTGVGHQRRHVGGKEVFANTDTKDQRTGFPHRHDFPRTVGAENAEGTMVAGGLTVTVYYEIALDLYEGVLHVISVDEITEQSSGGETIGVIA